MRGGSRIARGTLGRWSGVKPAAYKEEGEGYRGMTRYVLMAASTGDRALSFDVRYFEVAAGGYSTLERHDHPHAVLVLSGRGQVILDDEVSELTPFDCVYVAPGTLHQFRAAPDEPLGFLCIVDRDRDKPAAATPDDIARLCRNPVIAELLQTGRKLGPS